MGRNDCDFEAHGDGSTILHILQWVEVLRRGVSYWSRFAFERSVIFAGVRFLG